VTIVSEGGKLVNPVGVAVEPAGTVVVADRVSGIVRIDPSTGAQTVVATGGSLSGPIGVAVRR
jgi:DNA-binding beta-propeller fold protein YncE